MDEVFTYTYIDTQLQMKLKQDLITPDFRLYLTMANYNYVIIRAVS